MTNDLLQTKSRSRRTQTARSNVSRSTRTSSPPPRKVRTTLTSSLPSQSHLRTRTRHFQVVAVREQIPFQSVLGNATRLKYRSLHVTARTRPANSDSVASVFRNAPVPSLLVGTALQLVVQISATLVIAPRESPAWSVHGLAMQLDVTTRGAMCHIGESRKSERNPPHEPCLASVAWSTRAPQLTHCNQILLGGQQEQ